MIKILLLIPLILLFPAARAQTKLTPEIIASGGGVSKFSEIELEWTVGESSIGSVSSTDRFYTIGFHQPILIIKVKPEEQTSSQANAQTNSEPSSHNITVFPNPVKDKLKVELQKTINENITLILSDINGTTLLQKNVFGIMNIAEIPFLQYLPGVYLLRVYDTNKKLINTFKITKGK